MALESVFTSVNETINTKGINQKNHKWFTFTDPTNNSSLVDEIVKRSRKESLQIGHMGEEPPYKSRDAFDKSVKTLLADLERKTGKNSVSCALSEELISSEAKFVSEDFLSYGSQECNDLDRLGILYIHSMLVCGHNHDGRKKEFIKRCIQLMNGRLTPANFPIFEARMPFEYKIVIFPINTVNNHWSALVWYAEDQTSIGGVTLRHYDSLGTTNHEAAMDVAEVLDNVEFFYSTVTQKRNPKIQCKVVNEEYNQQRDSMCGTWVTALSSILAVRAGMMCYTPIDTATKKTMANEFMSQWKKYMSKKYTASLNAYLFSLDSPFFSMYPDKPKVEEHARSCARARDAGYQGRLTTRMLKAFLSKCVGTDRHVNGVYVALELTDFHGNVKETFGTPKRELCAYAYVHCIYHEDPSLEVFAQVKVAYSKKTTTRTTEDSEASEEDDEVVDEEARRTIKHISLFVCIDGQCTRYTSTPELDVNAGMEFANIFTNRVAFVTVETSCIPLYGTYGALRLLKHLCTTRALPPRVEYISDLFPIPSDTSQHRTIFHNHFDSYVMRAAMSATFIDEIDFTATADPNHYAVEVQKLREIATAHLDNDARTEEYYRETWRRMYIEDCMGTWMQHLIQKRPYGGYNAIVSLDNLSLMPCKPRSHGANGIFRAGSEIEHIQKIQQHSGVCTLFQEFDTYPILFYNPSPGFAQPVWICLRDVLYTVSFVASQVGSFSNMHNIAIQAASDSGMKPVWAGCSIRFGRDARTPYYRAFSVEVREGTKKVVTKNLKFIESLISKPWIQCEMQTHHLEKMISVLPPSIYESNASDLYADVLCYLANTDCEEIYTRNGSVLPTRLLKRFTSEASSDSKHSRPSKRKTIDLSAIESDDDDDEIEVQRQNESS